MRRVCLRLCAIALCAVMGHGAMAQQDAPANAEQVASALLTVDIERLFSQSAFGERISRTYTEDRAALATENRRIADALREEELALAAQRPSMDVDVFRAEAEAFDEKAQGIRRAQDAKERALDVSLSEGRARFLDVSRPILIELMLERGAVAILDRRSVLISTGTIDVTDDAIERINTAIGDGADGQTDP